jgi:uncharacterized protein YjbI with pentapeptide repeats
MGKVMGKVMERAKFTEGGSLKGIIGDPGTGIYYWSYILENLTLDETSALEEYIFVDCDIDSMKIRDLEKERKIIFMNCKIRELEVNRSYIPNFRFIGCDLFHITFKNSNMPGIVFSGKGKDEQDDIKKITGRNVKEINKSRIDYTTFLSCNSNQMNIHDTRVFNTAFKHCQLEYMKIGDNVVMKAVDLRGTKISESNFNRCSLNHIRFRKGYFLLELIWYFIALFLTPFKVYRLMLPRIKNARKKKPLRLRLTPDEKDQIYRDIRKKIVRFRHSAKRMIYKMIVFNWLVDLLSSTEIFEVKYREADFSKDFRFYRHIQNLDYVDGLKKRRPMFAFWYFILANYMRSVPSILFRLAVVVFLFSFLYQNYAAFKFKVDLLEVRGDVSELIDSNGKPAKPFILSLKIFFNAGIYPLEPADNSTERLVLLEIIIGYFTLAVLAGISSSHLFERFSEPKSKEDGP